ncbi:hypothetical protein TNIN_328541 [Trichonephila inaurata madagascariensis]|uniref:Uncharacterized protein n=1 Tax=Trichonephila inaurata madagascariensis TaxID=2747483 RepID=A0A8X7CJK6_9ARAC|nr:hypothetical protein TNIN_328541 [Trichonephila inaurata madagascariensis]
MYRVCSESSRTHFFLGERVDERRCECAQWVEGDIRNAGKNRQSAFGHRREQVACTVNLVETPHHGKSWNVFWSSDTPSNLAAWFKIISVRESRYD